MHKYYLRLWDLLRDLCILFDPKLKFDCHINNIVNWSNKVLDFIHHNYVNLTDKHVIKFYILLLSFIHIYLIYIGLWYTPPVHIVSSPNRSFIEIY